MRKKEHFRFTTRGAYAAHSNRHEDVSRAAVRSLGQAQDRAIVGRRTLARLTMSARSPLESAMRRLFDRGLFSCLWLCALSLGLVIPAVAQDSGDASVKSRLDARGLKYDVDGDGDFKITYNYKKENRTQLVFVSGKSETVGGFNIREVFSPAARVEKDGINGKKALELMAESRDNKLGGWELAGDVLYFVIKLPDNMDGAQLESAMDIAAQTADDMELEISGDRDDL
jgi:hypothetical protein